MSQPDLDIIEEEEDEFLQDAKLRFHDMLIEELNKSQGGKKVINKVWSTFQEILHNELLGDPLKEGAKESSKEGFKSASVKPSDVKIVIKEEKKEEKEEKQ
jgi:hypothetical protein